jgi:hypothetical protein
MWEKMSRAGLIISAFLLLFSSVAVQAADEDWISKLPPPTAGMGRIFIYRIPSMFGAAFQPAIYVNGQKVADAEMRRVHVIDRPAGEYEVRVRLEGTWKLNLTLAAGETRYVRLVTYPEVFTPRIEPQLKEAGEGEKDVQGIRRGKTFETLSVPEDPPFIPDKP